MMMTVQCGRRACLWARKAIEFVFFRLSLVEVQGKAAE
eukprot:COSAG05_NODE_2290_length_3269_cov_2.473186_3_plen_38_part_00